MTDGAGYWPDFVTPAGPNLDLIPSGMELARADLPNSGVRVTQIEELRTILAEDGVDFLIIDLPPSLGVAAQAALLAADEVIIPIRLDVFSTAGMMELTRQVDSMRSVNPRLRVAGILGTQFQRTAEERENHRLLALKSGLPVFRTLIRMSPPVPKSIAARESVLTFSPIAGPRRTTGPSYGNIWRETMGDFSLAEVLRGQLQNAGADVSKLDTSGGREQIEYISLDRIDSDPNNFYELSGLDKLAANIELLGLQQPLRVRQNPDAADRVIIVSGHRRRAALQKLANEGRTDFQEVPCIRDRITGSAALQELRLIYANSDTRMLTSAELSRQAERVEQLLYHLKEEGMEFPGRMRDHVAEACKVSKSKLARLKVIRENLIPEFAKHYKANRLKETSAYTLAQQPADLQKLVWKYSDTKHLESLSEWQISNMLGKIKPVLERTCRRKEGRPPCEHQAVLLAKIFDDSYSYKPCDRMCCDKCEKLASCKSACPLLAEKVRKLRTDRAAQNKQEKLAGQERDRPEVEAISAFWEREAAARAKTGKSVKALFKATETYYSDENEKLWLEREAQQKIKRGDTLPFGMYGFYLSEARRLVATADFRVPGEAEQPVSILRTASQNDGPGCASDACGNCGHCRVPGSEKGGLHRWGQDLRPQKENCRVTWAC